MLGYSIHVLFTSNVVCFSGYFLTTQCWWWELCSHFVRLSDAIGRFLFENFAFVLHALILIVGKHFSILTAIGLQPDTYVMLKSTKYVHVLNAIGSVSDYPVTHVHGSEPRSLNYLHTMLGHYRSEPVFNRLQKAGGSQVYILFVCCISIFPSIVYRFWLVFCWRLKNNSEMVLCKLYSRRIHVLSIGITTRSFFNDFNSLNWLS